eukprot:scaffold99034_cov69-Phaeocystis_antarctica.AAC.2
MHSIPRETRTTQRRYTDGHHWDAHRHTTGHAQAHDPSIPAPPLPHCFSTVRTTPNPGVNTE